jgi:hypothetical protein
MSIDPNAAPMVLTRWRRFNLVFLSFIAWGWLLLAVGELLHSARAALRCPAEIKSWPNYGLFFAPIVAALPFVYLGWTRSWYRRHRPIAWFSVPWWRRNARRGLVIALLFIVPYAAFETYSYRVGGNLAAKLAENFVQTDPTLQRLRAQRQFGEGFESTKGELRTHYDFRPSVGQPGDLIVVHLDRKGTQWSVCCWELASHSHSSFYTVMGGKSVEVFPPTKELAENFIRIDPMIQKLTANRQLRFGGESFDYDRHWWNATYKFWISGTTPEDLVIVQLRRGGTDWRVSSWQLDSHSYTSFFKVVDDKSVPVGCL